MRRYEKSLFIELPVLVAILLLSIFYFENSYDFPSKKINLDLQFHSSRCVSRYSRSVRSCGSIFSNSSRSRSLSSCSSVGAKPCTAISLKSLPAFVRYTSLLLPSSGFGLISINFLAESLLSVFVMVAFVTWNALASARGVQPSPSLHIWLITLK